ncbi:MAG: GDSL-type esterase/lipase family protein [Thermoactinomyces sp.]
MKQGLLWIKSLNWLALISFCLLLAGFGLAVREILGPETNRNMAGIKPPPSVPSEGLLLGLGDSLTRGVGDKNGLGYFGIIKKRWHASSHNRSRAINLSIRGQTSQNLREQFNKGQTRQFVKEADTIVITIGGNDLFRESRDIEQLDIRTIKERKKQFTENLDAILSEIHRLNPKCSVYLFSLYDPFGDLSDSERTSAIVADWNHATIVTALPFDQVTVVPVYDLFHKNPRLYLYSDHFHPNDKGYQKMADRLWQVMNTAEPEVNSPHAVRN